ncbi:RluA family pseudouridine synthase [Pseudooceanicola sp. HF7]|uniref:RluA family pseudouridine synthase n=1 Tax=Pseudooceanicola sp. HF7 TaxID=2721560 RepID=UPI001431856F|nr:RluA family pseudouridine synthase [Pseudooceanicola sp. HF7]NIZ08246.1 RluA family pseudouridine synthase [Pseudooceanicola sp. HF7]
MSGVQTISIPEADSGMRLDRWMRRTFPQLTQGRIEKMCRKGELRVDGGRIKSNHRLEPGQQLRVPPIPVDEAPKAPSEPRVSDDDAKMIQGCVIYRDDHIIAINKPPGLPVQGGSKQTRHVDGLAEALKFGYDEKPRLVHRLDKDTSGLLLLARTRQAAQKLTAAFRSRETRKIYWAVVAGVPTPYMGTITFGLVKAPGHGKGGEGEKMLCVHPRDIDKTPDAKRAVTDYANLWRLGQRATWVALVPVTGRTHQLRAHMAEMGHPIIGDGKYGGSGQENLGDGWGAQLGGDISRKLHLHARLLRLTHPFTGKPLELEAELPDHMRRSWDHFGWSEKDVRKDPFDLDEPL